MLKTVLFTLVLALSLILSVPAAQAAFCAAPGVLVASASDDSGNNSQGQPGGKVVITGKGGKVTSVKKPKKNGKK
ncbi:hypothetical protein GM415_01665 [Pseudodesulfovibrio cashew]|uniref:Uncharacterized protein n=1 Tax=Pseudodesulfovibrio cashew TaxID=2678688 RepID=A0A6I6J7T7_9BACT|nr:hypothetical protein [Pseudodesulfovibrio cashew]QGY38896.1 hypothetical protein GM415_01665 [Pseudodesulfovibrio cashew]